MKRIALGLAAVFVILLAVVASSRMSTGAKDVLAGICIGIIMSGLCWFAMMAITDKQDSISENNHKPEAQPRPTTLTVYDHCTLYLGETKIANVFPALPQGRFVYPYEMIERG